MFYYTDNVVGYSQFSILNEEVEWLDNVSQLGGNIPRLFALQGIVNEEYPLYRHPLDFHVEVKPFTRTVRAVKDIIEKKLNTTFNHAIIQKYRNGSDFIGPHADKTLDINPDSLIVNYSAGTTRVIKFRTKYEPYEIKTFELEDDSLLAINLDTNRNYTHEIKRNKKIQEERISITFRNIGTFYNPTTKIIRGLGELKNTELSRTELIGKFHLENKTTMDSSALYKDGYGSLL